MVEGLNTADAQTRLQRFGRNVVPEEKPRPILLLLRKLWGPVPWMLEFSVLLELVIGRYTQVVIIGLLLFFNAAISYLQESRAQGALGLLRSKLSVRVTVRRDGAWQQLPAEELVPDDVVHLQTGNLVPADVVVLSGSLAVDQSTLTGESLPVEVEVNRPARCRGHHHARRGGCQGHCDGRTDLVREDYGARSDSPHLEPPGDNHPGYCPLFDRSGCGAGDRCPRVFLAAWHFVCRFDSLCPHVISCLRSGGLARNIHSGFGRRSARTGGQGGPCHAPARD